MHFVCQQTHTYKGGSREEAQTTWAYPHVINKKMNTNHWVETILLRSCWIHRDLSQNYLLWLLVQNAASHPQKWQLLSISFREIIMAKGWVLCQRKVFFFIYLLTQILMEIIISVYRIQEMKYRIFKYVQEEAWRKEIKEFGIYHPNN